MVPVISSVGSAKGGKTFFIEKLVSELRRRKYKVGAIKHTYHSFEIDKPGKDSYGLKECGSSTGEIFPNDKALLKMLYLAIMDATERWTLRLRDWPLILSQLTIYFKKRLNDYVI